MINSDSDKLNNNQFLVDTARSPGTMDAKVIPASGTVVGTGLHLNPGQVV